MRRLSHTWRVWAKDIARKSQNVWASTGKVTLPLAFLLATSPGRLKVAEKLPADAQVATPMQFARLVDKCLEDYYNLIADNNGVKERNVLSLLSRLGAPNTAYGATLLPDLDSLSL